MNEVNGGDNDCVRSMCVCVSVCAQRTGQSDYGELNANSSKTVKAMDYKFNTRVCRDSPYITL